MTSGDEASRGPARILSEFRLSLLDEGGAALDAGALARDVSEAGFKIESRADLAPGQLVEFVLSLDGGAVRGRARIAWSERTDASCWAGATLVKMSWRDRRRVRRATRPSTVDWDGIADKAIVALSVLLATLVGWSVFSSALWRGIVLRLLPTAFAALVMGWALRELLRRRR